MRSDLKALLVSSGVGEERRVHLVYEDGSRELRPVGEPVRTPAGATRRMAAVQPGADPVVVVVPGDQQRQPVGDYVLLVGHEAVPLHMPPTSVMAVVDTADLARGASVKGCEPLALDDAHQ